VGSGHDHVLPHLYNPLIILSLKVKLIGTKESFVKWTQTTSYVTPYLTVTLSSDFVNSNCSILSSPPFYSDNGLHITSPQHSLSISHLLSRALLSLLYCCVTIFLTSEDPFVSSRLFLHSVSHIFVIFTRTGESSKKNVRYMIKERQTKHVFLFPSLLLQFRVTFLLCWRMSKV